MPRASTFWEILLESHIEASAMVINRTSFITDSNVQLKGLRHAIIEIKNEIGSKGTEPHAQAISYYIHATKSSVTETSGFRFLHSDYALQYVLNFVLLAKSNAHYPLRCPYWLLGCCLEHSSECTGAFDCSVSTLASYRYQNARDGCASFWSAEECSLLSPNKTFILSSLGLSDHCNQWCEMLITG